MIDDRYFTREQIAEAVEKNKGYLAHDNMTELLEQMDRMHLTNIDFFRCTETQRELLIWVGITPLKKGHVTPAQYPVIKKALDRFEQLVQHEGEPRISGTDKRTVAMALIALEEWNKATEKK